MSRHKQKDEVSSLLIKNKKKFQVPSNAREKSLQAFQHGLTELKGIEKLSQKRRNMRQRMNLVFVTIVTVGIAVLIFLSSGLLEPGNTGEGGEGNQEVYTPTEKSKESEAIIDEILSEREGEIKKLDEEYDDIIRLIQEYQYPIEGVVKEVNNIVYYENGYHLFKTGMGFAVEYDPNVSPPEPTKEQYLPIIVGLIHSTYNEDVQRYGMDTISQYIEETIEQLNRAKSYTEEYPAISEWLKETIEYLEEAKALVPNDQAKLPLMKALTNKDNFVKAKEIAEK